MASFSMPNVEGLSSVEELKNAVGKMSKELTWLLNHLDSKNMNYIDGDILVSGTVTAAKMLVDELSAITANLGHITAGLIESIEIYGSYIATVSGSYPRCEMNSDNNEITSFSSASQYISMKPSFGGDPLLKLSSNGYDSYMENGSGVTSLLSERTLILSSNLGDIQLQTGAGVKIENFYNFIESFTGMSLQQKLDELSDRITALGG